MKFVAVIPARGGSKRLKNKNLRLLCGKPLVYYPIKACLDCELIDRVIVSTDSEKIAETSKELGAEVPFLRPPNLAQDDSEVVYSVRHALLSLYGIDKFRADFSVLIQPTTPLITTNHIGQTVAVAIDSGEVDSVVAVTEVDHLSHPYNIRKIIPDGTLMFWKEKDHNEYYMKEKPKFHKSAGIWVSSYETVVVQEKLEGYLNYPSILDIQLCLDIDTKEDLELAKKVMECPEK